MSVFIKDIEMPKACDECPFFEDDYDYPTCIVNGKSEGYRSWRKVLKARMDFCPLVDGKEYEEAYISWLDEISE